MLQTFPQLRGQVAQAHVDDKPDWRRAYGARIPVLLSGDGEVLAEGRFSPDKLHAALNA